MEVFNSLTAREVIDLLRQGAVGVIPADTVYGLMGSATNPAAVARLYSLKKRDQKPGTIIAADLDQLVSLGLKRRYVQAVEQFWPGAVSVIIPCGAELDYLDQGLRGLAVRVPDDITLLSLLKETGPLLTTSANQPGAPTANTIREARSYFDDQVDFYVDGGDLSGRPPSTVIRIVDDAIEVVRQGAVKV